MTLIQINTRGWLKAFSLTVLLIAVNACSRSPNSKSDLNTESAKATGVSVSQAHMYVMPPGQKRAAIYMRLKNHADKTRTLLYASTVIAGATEVHHTVHEAGMMKMREVKSLKINAGQVIDFEPGSYHIMLLDVAMRPKAGDTVDLMLEFDGQTLIVPVAVKAVE